MWWGNHGQRILHQASLHLWSPHPRLPRLSLAVAYSDVPKTKRKLAPLQICHRNERWWIGLRYGPREVKVGMVVVAIDAAGLIVMADLMVETVEEVVMSSLSALSVWDFSNLQHHLNAQRGGHGTSKNKVGSRGVNKVAYVPVGTVIHLVRGEFPFAESSSNTSLDPWDMSADDGDQANSLHQINKVNVNCSSPVEDLHATTLYSKDHVNKPLCDTSKRFGSSAYTEVEQREGTKINGSYCQAAYADLNNETNDDEDIHENEIRINENEVEEEEEVEEDEEEVVQYSVAELTEPGQRLIVAQGGEGGLGNISLNKDCKSRGNAYYQADTSSSETLFENPLATGKPGSESVLILELKSIADVGLIGMPNAGKSTLLGAISRAKPAVGHYAFTTLRPNLGNLNYDDFFSVKVADIPGLIKGAHQNRGLGHAFLRHIERTKVLVYVVDLAAALDGREGIPPWEQLKDLALELEYHQEGLSSRPSLIVANKIDEHGAERVLKELMRRVQDVPIFPVCAILQEGVPELKLGIRKLIDGSELHRLNLDNILVD